MQLGAFTQSRRAQGGCCLAEGLQHSFVQRALFLVAERRRTGFEHAGQPEQRGGIRRGAVAAADQLRQPVEGGFVNRDLGAAAGQVELQAGRDRTPADLRLQRLFQAGFKAVHPAGHAPAHVEGLAVDRLQRPSPARFAATAVNGGKAGHGLQRGDICRHVASIPLRRGKE